jgi:hypothetical protein
MWVDVLTACSYMPTSLSREQQRECPKSSLRTSQRQGEDMFLGETDVSVLVIKLLALQAIATRKQLIDKY